jgi:hypothetical protein
MSLLPHQPSLIGSTFFKPSASSGGRGDGSLIRYRSVRSSAFTRIDPDCESKRQTMWQISNRGSRFSAHTNAVDLQTGLLAELARKRSFDGHHRNGRLTLRLNQVERGQNANRATGTPATSEQSFWRTRSTMALLVPHSSIAFD